MPGLGVTKWRQLCCDGAMTRRGTTFECHTLMPMTPLRAYELSLSIDAHTASLADTREQAVGGVTGGTIGLGEQVTWRAVHFGIPFRLTSSITEADAPRRFVDEQLRGPFARFHHEHLFEPTGDGQTLMTDVVQFVAPFGPLGWLAEKLVLDRYMRRLIERRNEYLAAV